jgi:Carboxypeptidase regulatory-like domain
MAGRDAALKSLCVHTRICASLIAAVLMSMVSVCVGQGQPQQQPGTASIGGTVTDPTGAVVSDAKVVLTSGYDHAARLSISVDDKGAYSVTGLYPGTYTLIVSAPGLADTVFEDLNLNSGKRLTLDAKLKPASAQLAGEASRAAQVEQSAVAAAQKIPGGGCAIKGTVNDQTGAVVVNAKAVLTSAAGEKFEAQVNAKGEYSFTGLKPGTYTLVVSAPNFADQTFDNVTLTGGVEQTLDASLALANAQEKVNVEASGAGQVETENATVSGTIEQKEVVGLQLNGRNFSQLIALAAGVSNQTGQDEGKVGVVGSVKYSVNGGRVEYNSYEVDGSDVLNTGLNRSASTLVVYPSIDAIQEVKVLTSNYGAQYGRTASGTVQVTTKSGTPSFHGGVYDFIRNEAFNARNYFDQTTKAPLYRRQDFGGTVGGPLTIPNVYNTKKDKTFFFFSEEVRLEKTPTDYNQAVPGLKERGLIQTPQGIQQNLGVNSTNPGAVAQIFDFTDVCPPFGSSPTFNRQQYPDCPSYGNLGSAATEQPAYFLEGAPSLGDIVPFGVDKNSRVILNANLFPLPNSATGCNYALPLTTILGPDDPYRCYVAAVSPSTYWREELFKIDHNLTQKLRLAFRYVHDAWDTTVLTPQWNYLSVTNPSAETFPTIQNRFFGPGISLVASVTDTITPTLINTFAASYVNSTITLANLNGPGGAQFQRNPALDQALVSSGQPGCDPTLSRDPATLLPECGMGYIFSNGFGGKMPGVAILGTNAAYGGRGFVEDPSYMPWEHSNPTYSIRDDVGKQVGRHTLTFGTQYVLSQRNQDNNVIGAASGDVQGLLTYSNLSNSTGNAFADFLVQQQLTSAEPDNVRSFIQTFTQDSAQHRYYQQYQTSEPYFQDDWKVTHRLTLNLGLRLSLFGTYSEKNHAAWNWEASRFDRTRFGVNPQTGVLLDGGNPVTFAPNTFALDPSVVSGLGMVQCGVGGIPAACMSGHLFNWAPRIGFAWDPQGDGKTSIRGGYGVFFEHGTGNEANTGSLEASAPVVLSVTQPDPYSLTCIGNVGFGNYNQQVGTGNYCGGATQPADSLYPIDVTSIPTHAVWPYVQQWSFGIQRELRHDFVINLAYAGSKGTHLTVERQLNQLPPLPLSENPFGANEPLTLNDCTIAPASSSGEVFPGDGTTPFQLGSGTIVGPDTPAYQYLQAACTNLHTPNVNSLPGRPYPGLGRVLSLENVANSTYHALQFTARRTRGAFTTGLSYSYSHSIDDSSDRSDPVLVNSYDLQENRASSNFDERHLLTLSYIYQFSFRRFFRALSDWANEQESRNGQATIPAPSHPGWGSRISDSWEFSGITLMHSGTPFTVINTAGNTGISVSDNAGVSSNLGIAASYPDVARGLGIPANNPQSFGPLLENPSQFVAPRGLTFGDAGRNFLNNPHQVNFDMALAKHFRITEVSQLDFRAEAFNIFNHTEFRTYDPDNPGSTGNNVISCYAGPTYSAGYKGSAADCVTGASFLHPIDAHRPRTLQFALKLSF